LRKAGHDIRTERIDESRFRFVLGTKEVSAGGEPKGGNLQNPGQAHVGRSTAETQPLAEMANDAPSFQDFNAKQGSLFERRSA